ncbi:hypothetical protein SKAU_G00053760 [Synaphobranchus kaupii]|uniref:Uncharacterized protein n=1 Tax=Synaphobranchus kaupii TaxID=118154 RepID=A0A9Q1G4E4_SYNKA|nr:hypothetical protein SKAU_G00053760 [Synaphobranchus kaupii]
MIPSAELLNFCKCFLNGRQSSCDPSSGERELKRRGSTVPIGNRGNQGQVNGTARSDPCAEGVAAQLYKSIEEQSCGAQVARPRRDASRFLSTAAVNQDRAGFDIRSASLCLHRVMVNVNNHHRGEREHNGVLYG